jgi:hypothetical protein
MGRLMSAYTPEEIDRTIALLEAFVDNRALLARISPEQRIALLIAAGKVSRPNRDEKQRMSKAF